MLEFKKPIPVIVEGNKKGFAVYVCNNGMFENDVWCVVHNEGGIVRHYLSNQIKIEFNATYNIEKQLNNKQNE